MALTRKTPGSVSIMRIGVCRFEAVHRWCQLGGRNRCIVLVVPWQMILRQVGWGMGAYLTYHQSPK